MANNRIPYAVNLDGQRKFIRAWHNFIHNEDESYVQSTAREWLKKFYRGDVDDANEQLVFENPQDLTYFLLRWS
jgi:hypothetical protein